MPALDSKPYPRKQTKNLCNQRFGRLHVIGFAGYTTKHRRAKWLCKCDCNQWIIIEANFLRTGNTRSCGCLQKEIASKRLKTHGQSGIQGQKTTSEYKIWEAAKARCTQPSSHAFKRYGGRGIQFLFTSFEHFFATLGPRPSLDYSLDRIDNDGPYSPENCRWATRHQQARNKRTTHNIVAFGRTQCLRDWAMETGRTEITITDRLKRGWCPECTMAIAPRGGTCIHKTFNSLIRSLRA